MSVSEGLSSAPAGFSRREFVKTAAVAGAALATPSLLVARSAWAGGADTLKLGLIGCGGRGSGAAIQALAADPGTVLWSMGDVFKDRIDSAHKSIVEEQGESAKERILVADDRRFVGFDSYQQVIDSGVDVVLLTSYPCFRPAHLRAALASGKHVFAEKPVAVDGPGIRSILESAKVAKDKGRACLIGFCWRYNASMREAFTRVQAGVLGDVTSVHTTYHTGTLSKRPRKPEWSDLEFQMRNWWHFTWISGDHLVEQAVHSVDRMAWAMGDRIPKRVQCLGGRAARSGPEHGNVFDHFSAIYEYENGVRTHHSCRQIDGTPQDNSDYIYGTKGWGSVNGWSALFPFKDYSGGTLWDGKGSADDTSRMYFDEHKELFASIRAGKPVNDCERGARSCLMAIMARMAAYTGQTVTWEQALNSQESLVPEKLEWGPMATPAVAVPGQTKFA
ncbi:MAG: Gfo/Idh/MocA family oxidoreductase [Phycisphaerae bacterium]|nr:Gfo/Idh/MocA family oxidoreductase [Phycisphaerae bacterium]